MATEIVIPNVGESITSGVIATWLVAEGEYIERDETVLELETDKVTMELPSPISGILSKHLFAEGDEVEVGAVVGQIDETASRPAASKPKVQVAAAAGGSDTTATTATVAPPVPAADPAPTGGDAKATPLAKKLAADRGVDLHKVHGTGASGRIREQDVLSFVQTAETPVSSAEEAVESPRTGSRTITRERMSPLRQRIASRLVEAQQTAAILTTFNECDMTAVMALRKQYKETFIARHGVGLGFMSFFVKACVKALNEFPLVNAAIMADDSGKPSVQKHNYQDIAIAVSSPKGLVVPVIRNAETLSFAGIEKNIKDLGGRARDGKLELAEMQGGTFTITNGGIFGSLMSTPILNPPQSAILGMHTIKKRAVEDPTNPGQVALRPMMFLALSYDHRIVDGAEAVQFLVSIKDSIEDPQRLMLEI